VLQATPVAEDVRRKPPRLDLGNFASLTERPQLIAQFAIGMVVYFAYGVRRSKLAQPPARKE
jgi:hypothetical protein